MPMMLDLIGSWPLLEGCVAIDPKAPLKRSKTCH
jgi:hypothetical protein